MNNYINTLESVSLFKDIDSNDILQVLKCLNAEIKIYNKNENIFMQLDKINNIGIIVLGKVRIQKEDMNGNVVVTAELLPGDLFGEAFVFSETQQIPISVWASSDAHIIFIDYKKISTTCYFNCSHHQKLINNMLKIMSQKLLMLTKKIDILQKTNTREKILTLLKQYSLSSNNDYFEIPFNRNELSEYLNVNRSALSRELSKMQNENIIIFKKNKFKLC